MALAPAQAPIITVTANPALDITTGVERLADGVKLRCEEPLRDPGGGGINASRAIRELGGHSVAVHTAGGPEGEALAALLAEAALDTVAVRIDGPTRQSFAVHERSTGRLYRFVLPGPAPAAHEWEGFLAAVTGRLEAGAVVLVSGSLPPGAPRDLVARVARACTRVGARCVVDVAGEPMRAALGAGVHMARFNRPEFEEYAGVPLDDVPARAAAARRLVAEGAARVVIATLGPDGALVADAAGVLHLRAPRVEADNPVGAGDSMMGAVCLGLAHGWDLDVTAALGVAAAAAAHMTPATRLCRRQDVVALFTAMRGGPPPPPVA